MSEPENSGSDGEYGSESSTSDSGPELVARAPVFVAKGARKRPQATDVVDVQHDDGPRTTICEPAPELEPVASVLAYEKWRRREYARYQRYRDKMIERERQLADRMEGPGDSSADGPGRGASSSATSSRGASSGATVASTSGPISRTADGRATPDPHLRSDHSRPTRYRPQ